MFSDRTVGWAEDNAVSVKMGVYLGDTGEMVTALAGMPKRIEPGDFGLEWWVYNQRPDCLLMVALRGERVQAVFSTNPAVSAGGVTIGQPFPAHYRIVGSNRVTAHLNGVEYGFQLGNRDRRERPLIITGNEAVIFYLDAYQGGRVAGILLLNLEMLVQGGYYQYQVNSPGVRSCESPVSAVAVDPQITRAMTRQMLDLVNASRRQNSLPLLTPDAMAAELARKHCQDMATNGFFSHRSPTTGSFADRVYRSGISFVLAAENLAMGQVNPIDAHFNWLNSPGHRRNILDSELKAGGAAVVYGSNRGQSVRYFGQVFLTRK
ncbi:MAG: CAP-associated domain-containing protein [Heliobacteriaceae bacterium]|nr:CAP-associated domain-containing protein [Heliobacteriaceae bacterium]